MRKLSARQVGLWIVASIIVMFSKAICESFLLPALELDASIESWISGFADALHWLGLISFGFAISALEKSKRGSKS